jgi:WD repeat/SOCS box-containing protein 1
MFDDGNLYKTLDKHMDIVCSCDWSPTSSLLCTVGVKRQAYIWDTKTFSVKFRLVGHMHDILSCEFSKDGALLATASFDTKIIIWDPYSGEAMKQL